MKLSRQALIRWANRRAVRQRENIALFTAGACGFFAGMGLILYAEQSLSPSLGQELVALLGVCLASAGGIAAIIGYLSLSVLRFVRLASRDIASTDETKHQKS